MKAVVAAFNQEKALVGAFSVIVQPVVEPMDRFAALIRDVDSSTLQILLLFMYSGRVEVEGINPAKIMKLLTAADLYQVWQQTFL